MKLLNRTLEIRPLRRVGSSIQRLPVAFEADGEHLQQKQGDGPEVGKYFGQPIPLEHDAAHDAQVMGEREHFDALGPDRHPPEGEPGAGEQDRGEEEEKRHLHRLQLIAGQGQKVRPTPRLAAMNSSETSSSNGRLPTSGSGT